MTCTTNIEGIAKETMYGMWATYDEHPLKKFTCTYPKKLLVLECPDQTKMSAAMECLLEDTTALKPWYCLENCSGNEDDCSTPTPTGGDWTGCNVTESATSDCGTCTDPPTPVPDSSQSGTTGSPVSPAAAGKSSTKQTSIVYALMCVVMMMALVLD